MTDRPAPAGATDAVLDEPVASALSGPHAHLARRVGRAASYQRAVATFSAVPLDPTGRDWADLATLLGPGRFADLFSLPVTPPADWEPVFTMPGFQMLGDVAALADAPADPAVEELSADDAPAMRALAEETKPGPFWERTHETGRYVGVRDDAGRLVAMAGERLRLSGWTEVSAVCTAPDARGRGLAERLVRDVAARIIERGDRPFLHVAATNTGAIRLYERLGFTVRAEVEFHGYRVPNERTPPRPKPERERNFVTAARDMFARTDGHCGPTPLGSEDGAMNAFELSGPRAVERSACN
ncbi:putative acetyltransferase [Nocardioides sp. J9]|nr:putative acetyltransferase [Nocardioides sp. J9]